MSLPQAHALTWDSPIWAQITNSSAQLLETDQGQQKGLQSLFADLLPTGPINTPFVLHDVHRRPSVCGNDLKPDVVMALSDKPCVPLTTAAIINFKQQGGGYDNDENAGKAIIYGRVFLQQFPRSLRRVVVVGLTDLLSITLILARLNVIDGNEHLSFDMSPQIPDVKYTLLQLLSSEPERVFVEMPDLGASVQVVDLLGCGATSHVYKAFQGGQQVMSSIVRSVQRAEQNCLFAWHKISICHNSMQMCFWVSSTCLPRQAIRPAASVVPQKIVRLPSHAGSAQAFRLCARLCGRLCTQDCIQCAGTCHIRSICQRPCTMAEPLSTCILWVARLLPRCHCLLITFLKSAQSCNACKALLGSPAWYMISACVTAC